MPICAITLCRNYKGRLKTTKKVTYHQIPTDPILRSKWIDIIRKSRGDDVWQPTKTTVICSDHFRAKDMYFTKKQERRRLKKKAIPCKALFLASLETNNESDESIEETGNISNRVANIIDDTKCLESNEKEDSGVTKDKCYVSSCIGSSYNIIDNASGITNSSIPRKTSDSKIADKQKTENDRDTIEDFSDIDSIFDTPRKSKLRRDLRRKTQFQKKLALKIQSLRRKNLRLTKKISSFKQIITTLKKERYIDNDAYNILRRALQLRATKESP